MIPLGGKTFNDKFLTFLGLPPGDPGLGDICDCERFSRSPPSGVTATVDLFISVLKGDKGAADVGDSGDELGEGSVLAVTDAESKVEIVVVGEESVESDPTEVMLPLC